MHPTIALHALGPFIPILSWQKMLCTISGLHLRPTYHQINQFHIYLPSLSHLMILVRISFLFFGEFLSLKTSVLLQTRYREW